MRKFAVIFIISVSLTATVLCKKSANKYSKEANKSTTKAPVVVDDDLDDYRPPVNYTTTSERLFRIQKIQNIWHKAQATLSAAKLKSVYHDLKAHDKKELALKKIKAQGKDSDGLHEAALRNELSKIIENYGLQGKFPEHKKQDGDDLRIERMFKSKKLNKLWNKIENSGLDEKEMKILKEELSHHQQKLDQYYALVDNLHEDRDKTRDIENSVSHFLEAEVVDEKKGQPKVETASKFSKPVNTETKLTQQDLDQHYDEVAMKVRVRLNKREFTDERASKLWNLAGTADFSEVELESLREELHHFEHRLKKLDRLNSDLELRDNPDSAKHTKSKVQEYEKKVNKVHDELRGRILRRTEL